MITSKELLILAAFAIVAVAGGGSLLQPTPALADAPELQCNDCGPTFLTECEDCPYQFTINMGGTLYHCTNTSCGNDNGHAACNYTCI